MATVRKRRNRKNDYYYVDFTYQGRRYQISTRTVNKKLADKILMEIQMKIAKGIFNLGDYNQKDITTEEFFKKLAEVDNYNKSKSTIELRLICS